MKMLYIYKCFKTLLQYGRKSRKQFKQRIKVIIETSFKAFLFKDSQSQCLVTEINIKNSL